MITLYISVTYYGIYREDKGYHIIVWVSLFSLVVFYVTKM